MNNTRYSIVYAVIRPEINEQLSVGIILMDDSKTEYRYSENKLRALKELYSPKVYNTLETLIHNLGQDENITTQQGINYLHRYSNNLMALSELKDINLPLTSESSDWMFTHFIDRES